jgi:hypothetical protein
MGGGVPRWMGKAHFYDIDQEWETFVAHLRKGCDAPRVPFMAPDREDRNYGSPRERIGRKPEVVRLTNNHASMLPGRWDLAPGDQPGGSVYCQPLFQLNGASTRSSSGTPLSRWSKAHRVAA